MDQLDLRRCPEDKTLRFKNDSNRLDFERNTIMPVSNATEGTIGVGTFQLIASTRIRRARWPLRLDVGRG